MNLDKLNQWLLLVSHFGILAGLILVGIQINQDTELARIQIFAEATTARIQMHEAMLGDNPAPTIMKSLTNPEDLSLEELRVMDAYLLTAVNEARLRLVLAQEGLRVDAAEEENILFFYFGNPFAQAWWRQFTADGEDMSIEVNAQLDRIVRSAGEANLTLTFFDELGRRLTTDSVGGQSER